MTLRKDIKIKYSYNIMSEDWFLLVEAFFL